MILALIILILFILSVLAIKFFSIKIYGISMAVVLLLLSFWVCSFAPEMHKPFSIDIIEYLIKINDDGSMTTTKQVTKTVIEEKQSGKESK